MVRQPSRREQVSQGEPRLRPRRADQGRNRSVEQFAGTVLEDIGQREAVNGLLWQRAQGFPDISRHGREAIEPVPDRLEILLLQIVRHGDFVEVAAEQDLCEKVVRSCRQLGD